MYDSSWLEEEEENVLQKRAELQELEEEQRRREEVLQRREDCLQQKNKLEVKKLRSSQVTFFPSRTFKCREDIKRHFCVRNKLIVFLLFVCF